MDNKAFDDLTRAVATGLSRRAALRAIGGLAVSMTAVRGKATQAARDARVQICHSTGSPGNSRIIITVDQTSVAMHLDHGDWLLDAGTQCCGDDDCGSTDYCRAGTCCKSACSPGECGQAGDGCGGLIDCDHPCCAPRTTCSPDECGIADDGCGGELVCERPCCERKQECGQDECGFIDDGCGEQLTCDRLCNLGEQCDHDLDCIPLCGCSGLQCCRNECAASECGYIDDGCGGKLGCGVYCGSEETGGNGGTCEDDDDCAPDFECNNLGQCCRATCPVGSCGLIDDGCGGALDCLTPCGAGGPCDDDNDCSPGLTCTEGSVCCKTSCLDTEYGYVSDACGGEVDCGYVCGAGGPCGTDRDCAAGLACTEKQVCCRTRCPVGVCGMISDLCDASITCDQPCGVGAPCTEPGQCGSTMFCRDGFCCAPGCPGGACGWRIDSCAGEEIFCGVCGLGGSCTTDDDCDVAAGLGCVSDAGSEEPHCCRTSCLPDQGECGYIDDGHQLGNLVTCANKCEGGDACLGDEYCLEGLSCIDNRCCQASCLAGDCGEISDACGGVLACGDCPAKTCSHFSECGENSSLFPCCFDEQGIGACVDSHSDPNHCGQCNNACPTDQICCQGFCCSPEACCPQVENVSGIACLNSCAASGGHCADENGSLVCMCPDGASVPTNQVCGDQCTDGSHCPDLYACVAGNCCLAECPVGACGFISNGCGASLDCSATCPQVACCGLCTTNSDCPATCAVCRQFADGSNRCCNSNPICACGVSTS